MAMAVTFSRPGSAEERGRVPKILAGGFWISMGATLLLLAWKRAGDGKPMVDLVDGVALMEAGRLDEAETHFRAASRSDDSTTAAAAHHNLGLLLLSVAIGEGGGPPGPDGRGGGADDLLEEAIRHGDQALRLAPGSEATAWNLELALAKLSAPDRRMTPPPEGSHQNPDDPADTREERPVGQSGEAGPPDHRPLGLSQNAARQLLASFRLLERAGTRDVIRWLLSEGPASSPSRERGPPW